jgi:hypothetical protein
VTRFYLAEKLNFEIRMPLRTILDNFFSEKTLKLFEVCKKYYLITTFSYPKILFAQISKKSETQVIVFLEKNLKI